MEAKEKEKDQSTGTVQRRENRISWVAYHGCSLLGNIILSSIIHHILADPARRRCFIDAFMYVTTHSFHSIFDKYHFMLGNYFELYKYI